MTLRTANLSTQQNPNRIVDIRQGHPIISQLESDCWILPSLTISREHFVHPLIVTLVDPNRIFHISQVRIGHDICLRTFNKSQNIGPKVVHIADVIRTTQQLVYQVFPTRFGSRFQKPGRLLQCRNTSRDIEVHPTQKNFIACQLIGFLTLIKQL